MLCWISSFLTSLCSFSSSIGYKSIYFCLVAESPSPMLSRSDHHLTGSQKTPMSSITSSENSALVDSPNTISSDQQSEDVATNKRSFSMKRPRKWLLIEKQLLVLPGIHAHFAHHASWRESNRYVAVCQIDNQIRLSNSTLSPKSLLSSESPLGRAKTSPIVPQDKEMCLKITKIVGLLTYCGGHSEPSEQSDMKFFPIELTSLMKWSPSFELLEETSRSDNTLEYTEQEDSVIVPFDKSVQLLYTCKPFGPFPFDSWEHLKSLSSKAAAAKENVSSPLLKIFHVVRSTEIERQSFNPDETQLLASSSFRRQGGSNDGTTTNTRACRKLVKRPLMRLENQFFLTC